MAFRAHAAFRQNPAATCQCAKLATDDAGDPDRRDALGQQALRHHGQPRPGGGQRRHVFGRIDLIAQRNGVARAQPQQIARRQCADQPVVVIDHREVANAMRVHSPNGSIQVGVVKHRDERPFHMLAYGYRQRVHAGRGDGAQDVTLCDDG